MLEKEDCMRIPVRQVIEELDQILAKNQTEEAEKHLEYWLSKARKGNDRSGELTVLNEMMGLYRSMGKESEGLQAAEEGLELLDQMDLKEGVTAGTHWINAATTWKAFGQAEKALPLYEKCGGLTAVRWILRTTGLPDFRTIWRCLMQT